MASRKPLSRRGSVHLRKKRLLHKDPKAFVQDSTTSIVSTPTTILKPPLHVQHSGARLTLLSTGCLLKLLIGVANTVEIHHAHRLKNVVENRPPGVGLFTVSNHASMADPAIIANMYDWSQDLSCPQWPPWTLCTDTFFRVHPLLSFWLEAGKAMPITRASPKGLKQEYLRDFRDRLNAGEWCHLYPEGKITQPWRFPEGQSRLGKFLPGIGKLVTNCETPPLVVPIYHKGMHDILPEIVGDPRMPAKPKSLIPQIGKKVDIYIGEPVEISDLLEEADQSSEDVNSLERWQHETRDDLKKWLKISSRVRDAMRDLEEEAWANN
eukprot:CAMPEP_0167740418 /NCGR_PEP_ID=MMETSP0110_2-20121227/265_1 /TAXON_ID=629695 /ORGANISM="Gymnochlora sp., Strain CCMP2014" /LENGTH=322 /DNA_ID=CAMNT_0007624307 /DNA_START=3 /DNA_END=971 /DNA_ORIENTATION=-